MCSLIFFEQFFSVKAEFPDQIIRAGDGDHIPVLHGEVFHFVDWDGDAAGIGVVFVVVFFEGDVFAEGVDQGCKFRKNGTSIPHQRCAQYV